MRRRDRSPSWRHLFLRRRLLLRARSAPSQRERLVAVADLPLASVLLDLEEADLHEVLDRAIPSRGHLPGRVSPGSDAEDRVDHERRPVLSEDDAAGRLPRSPGLQLPDNGEPDGE